MPKIIDQEKTLLSLEKYIDATDIPYVEEFCHKAHISRNYIYNHDIYSDTIKDLLCKQEANLVRFALDGKIDKVFAIWCLKHLGWKDSTHFDVDKKETKTVNVNIRKEYGLSDAEGEALAEELLKRRSIQSKTSPN